MSHHLYFISQGPSGPIKIGHSSNAYARLSALQTGNPHPLRVLHAVDFPRKNVVNIERALHQWLADKALTGEWFDISEDFVDEHVPGFFYSLDPRTL